MPLQLLKGIRHFKNHQLKEEKDLFASLSKGQSPDVLFITCSDSRLSPHSFTHSGLGELFLGRNPGNIVPPYPDTSMPSGEAATIEFALTHLKSKEIIVCGHSHCGAMKGLLIPDLKKELPHTAAWLSHSSLLVEHIEKRHPDIAKNPSAKLIHLTQDNVLLQMEHLKTHPSVAKRLAEGTLTIHGWYYEIDTGEVHIYNLQKNAFVPFEQTVEEVATEKLRHVVEEEALNYLMSISAPKSMDDYVSLIQIYNKVRFTGVSSIWEHIEAKVTGQLRTQIGELYITDTGDVNPSFGELIKKGPSIRLKSLAGLHKVIKDSPFHKALSVSTSGHTFASQVLTSDAPLDVAGIQTPAKKVIEISSVAYQSIDKKSELAKRKEPGNHEPLVTIEQWNAFTNKSKTYLSNISNFLFFNFDNGKGSKKEDLQKLNLNPNEGTLTNTELNAKLSTLIFILAKPRKTDWQAGFAETASIKQLFNDIQKEQLNSSLTAAIKEVLHLPQITSYSKFIKAIKDAYSKDPRANDSYNDEMRLCVG